MERNIDKTYFDIFYLLHCYFNNIIPNDNKLKQMDFNKIYSYSKAHSVTSNITFALEKSSYFLSLPIKDKFINRRNNNIKKTILFDNERNIIFSLMDEKKIYHLPLKGIILKDLYPDLGAREFADNDILYDPNKQKELVKIFKSLNYEIESVNKTHHDTFLKQPIYNFEMHRYLFESVNKQLKQYYKDILDKCIKDESNPYLYHLSNEDDYIYDVAHSYKHYIAGGNGLRYLIDIYVYNKYKQLNYEYINKQLSINNILEFENKSKNIANKIINNQIDTLTDEEYEMLSYILNSGTYGTLKNSVNSFMENKKGNKFKYIWHRLYPGYEWVKQYHKFFAYTIIFIPLLIIYRAFIGVFFKRKKAKQELQFVDEYKENNK